MVNTEQERSTARFGVFELDLREGELRKHGIRVKLQQKPLQVLEILLQCAGSVVTREDIQARLWPADTYVDFDNAINSAVRKLRDALGDTAENPRFIETLARRGYRFVAPVSFNGALQVQPAVKAPQHQVSWYAFGLVAIVLAVLAALGTAYKRSGIGQPLLTSRPFTSYPGFEFMPSISPDATRIAFTWQKPSDTESQPSVYVKLIGAGEPVKLSSTGAFAPAWSSDGRFLAFLRIADIFHADLVVIPALGGEERKIARLIEATLDVAGRSAHHLAMPYLAWSADDKFIIAAAQASTGFLEPGVITRIAVDSGEQTVLTTAAWPTGGIALSADGRELAFTIRSGLWANDLYLARLTDDLLFSGKPIRLTFDQKGIYGVAWVGGSKDLVFSSYRSGQIELWRMMTEPVSRPVRINSTDVDTSDVAISRDGKQLVYSHSVDNQNIWQASLSGDHASGLKSLIASTRRDTQARYSPDGRRIAFESNRGGNEEVWMCNSDGSHPFQLTHFPNAWAGAPKWSPDGKQIAFAADAAGTWDIYVVSAEGGKPVRITGDEADESWPSWSHDGQWLYYFSTRGHKARIWKTRATGGGPETPVTKGSGYWSDEAPDGSALYNMSDRGVEMLRPNGNDPELLRAGVEFSITQRGVYFSEPSEAAINLSFFDSRTRQTRSLGTVPGILGWNLNVSPDEHSIIYSRTMREGSELLTVDDFR